MATLKKTTNWFSRPIIAQCRSEVLQNAPREHSAILSTFIKLPLVFKTFVLSIFVWLLKTGFTVHVQDVINSVSIGSANTKREYIVSQLEHSQILLIGEEQLGN